MRQPSALFVTTVPITLEAFLMPFSERFRGLGWRVDAAANGAASHARIAAAFDERFDVEWSRNPLAPGNLFGSTRTVREIVERGQYDIVHVHTPVAAFTTRFALRHRTPNRPAVIYTAHGFHFYTGQARGAHALYRSIERMAGPWTDYLVTINAEDEAAAYGLGIRPERIRRIPGIGVDMQRFADGAVTPESADAVRHELVVPDDAVMVVMVAEFAPVKRHQFLLDALAHVTDPRLVVVFVGDGPLESSIRESVNAHGLAERVRFAGYRRDIPAVLAAADALVLVSEREGLNHSVLEAMASARPVIGTATRGIADAVGAGSGWIVAKDDVHALAGALDSAASDPAERVRRGQAGRERAGREFALPRIISAYEELYDEALASGV